MIHCSVSVHLASSQAEPGGHLGTTGQFLYAINVSIAFDDAPSHTGPWGTTGPSRLGFEGAILSAPSQSILGRWLSSQGQGKSPAVFKNKVSKLSGVCLQCSWQRSAVSLMLSGRRKIRSGGHKSRSGCLVLTRDTQEEQLCFS